MDSIEKRGRKTTLHTASAPLGDIKQALADAHHFICSRDKRVKSNNYRLKLAFKGIAHGLRAAYRAVEVLEEELARQGKTIRYKDLFEPEDWEREKERIALYPFPPWELPGWRPKSYSRRLQHLLGRRGASS